MSSKAEMSDYQRQTWIWIGALVLFATWGFGNGLRETAANWQSAQYSHGWLVPVMAFGLLWLRRQPFDEEIPFWQRGVGLGIIAAGMLIRTWAALTVTQTVDRLMFVPVVVGIFVMIGGTRTLRWAGAPLLFLVFMYALPRFFEDGMLRQLKSLSTGGSLYALQTLGIEAYREGNRIELDQASLGVVDACSGLRMTTIFLALGAAIALLAVNRPIWERIIVFVSSMPIALAVNIIRITLTGMVKHMVGENAIAEKVSHDFAGLLMMPLAIGMLYLVSRILSRLIIEQESPLPHVGQGFQS